MTLALDQVQSDGAYRRGVMLVVLAGIFWSTMGLGIRMMEAAGVWQILLYRSMALVPFLFIVIYLRSGRLPISVIRAIGPSAIVGALGLVLAFSGGIYAIQTTSVANAMFLFAAAPFLAAILGLAVLKEPVRRATWISMVAALIGVAIMVGAGISLGFWVGNLAALISATGFAVFTVALRWKKTEDMLPTVLLAGLFSILISGSICLITGAPLAIPITDTAIALSMGIFQIGFGLTLYTVGSRVVPAAECALLSTIEVVLGPLWVWWILGETASATTILGGTILLAAIAGNALSGMRRRPVPITLS